MALALKRLAEKNLGAAVALAKHYRDLNQPEEAESICRDVLDVAPDDQDALQTLGLALTDQLPTRWMALFEEACSIFTRLKGDYERVYYTGIAWERYAKAQLAAGRDHNAIHAYETALGHFEKAEELAPKGEPAPVLHYNHCVRALTEHPDLVRASGTPHQPAYEFGD